MKLINVSTRYLPKQLDSTTLQIFVNEPFVIDMGGIYTMDLGFNLESAFNILGFLVHLQCTGDVFCYAVHLPFVRIINFGQKMTYEKGALLGIMSFSPKTVVKLTT